MHRPNPRVPTLPHRMSPVVRRRFSSTFELRGQVFLTKRIEQKGTIMRRSSMIMTRGSLVSVGFATLVWFGSASTPHAAELLPVRASYAAIGGVFWPGGIAQNHCPFPKYCAP